MGYTNYWTYDEKDTSDKSDELIKFAKKAIELSGVEVVGWDGSGEAEVANGVISLNGAADCETFQLLANADGNQCEFCKTKRLPYDMVVKACLIEALRLGIISNWRFDGKKADSEYKEGKQLANKTLKSLKEGNNG